MGFHKNQRSINRKLLTLAVYYIAFLLPTFSHLAVFYFHKALLLIIICHHPLENSKRK